MEVVGGIIVLLILVFVVMWLKEKLADLFFCLCDGIAGLFDGNRPKKTRSVESNSKSYTPDIKQVLPEPCDAHDILEAFCRIMHKIDVKMSPYCQNQGQAGLHGGVDEEGKGYVNFWYDKDYAGIDSVFHDIGYCSPSENDNQSGNSGWSIQDGVVRYNCHSITGYREWTGYDTTYKQFGKITAESSMQKMVEAVIKNEWPEARITSYNGQFDAPSGELIYFSAQIKTSI